MGFTDVCGFFPTTAFAPEGGPGTAQNVPGLGDAAFFNQSEIHAFRGGVYLSLNATLTDSF